MRIDYMGCVHRIAYCSDCDFIMEYGGRDGKDKPEYILRKVRYHIKETGHSVTVETGSVKYYSGCNNHTGK